MIKRVKREDYDHITETLLVNAIRVDTLQRDGGVGRGGRANGI